MGCTSPAFNNNTNTSSQGEVNENTTDTLELAFAYWAPSGIFSGSDCSVLADNIIFTGTVTKLYEPSKPYLVGGDNAINKDSTNLLYVPQSGVIKLNSILKVSDVQDPMAEDGAPRYNSEHFFVSDCFYNSGLKEGDKIVAFVGVYEGLFSIFDNRDVLKIESFDDPIISSIKTYIEAGSKATPLTINNDAEIWHKHGYDLKNVIKCWTEAHTR